MSRTGLITTKIGNSSFFSDDGSSVHVTLLKVDSCIVSKVKVKESDGYNAIQLASLETRKDIKRLTRYKLFSTTKSYSSIKK